MTSNDLLNKYAKVTASLIEPGRTVQVFKKISDKVEGGEEFQLVGILTIANPPLSGGKVMFRQCEDGTPGKDIFNLPLEIMTGEKPNAENRLWRIPK
jgi:hypothetical protein